MDEKLKLPRIPERQRRESICWFCKNAVPTRNENGNFVTGCEWSIRKQPVPGWQSIDKVRKRLGLDEYYTATRCRPARSLKEVRRINVDSKGILVAGEEPE